MKAALLLSFLFATTAAQAASEKLVQQIQTDIDGDSKADAIAEYDVGTAKNELRITLSKTGRTFRYSRLLPNPHFGKNNPDSCHDWQQNSLEAMPTRTLPSSTRLGEDEVLPAQVRVTIQKGANNGCDTGYSYDRTLYYIHASNKQWDPNSEIVPELDELIRVNYSYAHFECEYQAKRTFTANAVLVAQNLGYHQNTVRMSGDPLEENCTVTLDVVEKAGGLPACASRKARRLEAKLFTKAELKNLRGELEECGPASR